MLANIPAPWILWVSKSFTQNSRFPGSSPVASARKACRELLRGIDKLAETVAVTLGPRGRNVLLDKARCVLGCRGLGK